MYISSFLCGQNMSGVGLILFQRAIRDFLLTYADITM